VTDRMTVTVVICADTCALATDRKRAQGVSDSASADLTGLWAKLQALLA